MFMKSKEGVHFMNVLNLEYTICGTAFDNSEEEEDMLPTNKTIVTCPRCKAIIESCQKIKVQKSS